VAAIPVSSLQRLEDGVEREFWNEESVGLFKSIGESTSGSEGMFVEDRISGRMSGSILGLIECVLLP